MDVASGKKLLLKALKAGEKNLTSENIDAVVISENGIKEISFK